MITSALESLKKMDSSFMMSKFIQCIKYMKKCLKKEEI